MDFSDDKLELNDPDPNITDFFLPCLLCSSSTSWSICLTLSKSVFLSLSKSSIVSSCLKPGTELSSSGFDEDGISLRFVLPSLITKDFLFEGIGKRSFCSPSVNGVVLPLVPGTGVLVLDNEPLSPGKPSSSSVILCLGVVFRLEFLDVVWLK